MNDDFGVAAGSEMVPKLRQLFAKFDEVKYLTIEHDPYPIALASHGLLTRLQINDCQARMGKSGSIVLEYAEFVGATMK